MAFMALYHEKNFQTSFAVDPGPRHIISTEQPSTKFGDTVGLYDDCDRGDRDALSPTAFVAIFSIHARQTLNAIRFFGFVISVFLGDWNQ